MSALTGNVTMRKDIIGKTNLSSQEQEILFYFLNNLSDAIAASELGLTKKQIRGKRQNICSKIGRTFLLEERKNG